MRPLLLSFFVWPYAVFGAAAPIPIHTIRIGLANSRGEITDIKRLEMEKYLLGVVAREMSPDWPIEALKAQAVVARTYAYSELGRFDSDGFDLTSDTRSQIYDPGPVSDSARQAVSKTRGEVLGFHGELLGVYYHSCCGGHTTSPKTAWGAQARSPRPLRGVPDSVCHSSPYMRWTSFFTSKELSGLLGGRRLRGRNVAWVEVASRDRAGYATLLKAKIGRETVRVPGFLLRRELGDKDLPSLKIRRIVKLKGGFEFQGSGMGHGVGLCQWGAKLLALRGWPYERILKHYFPGAVLSVVVE